MVATRTRTRTKQSASDVLGGINSSKTPKSKSSTPLVTVTNPEQIAEIVAIVRAKLAAKAAKGAVDVAEGEFGPTARILHEQRCQNDATLHTSIKLVTKPEEGPSESLLFTQKRQCTKMLEAETSDILHRIFGEDFDDNFRIIKPLSIACDKLTDEQIVDVVKAIKKVLPQDVFDEVVDYLPLIKESESFFTRRMLDPRIRTLATQAETEGVAVPHKPSFKIG